MARLTFPSTGLYNGYQYIGGNGITYVYDGSKWRGQVPSITVISSSSISNHGNIVEVDEYGNLRLPYYVFPPTTGTFGEVLSWPISGSVLEWKKLQASTIDFSNITNVPAFSTATKLSNLLNDVGYLTSSTVLPYIPTQVSSFTNDVGYLTSSTVLPYIPTQVSSFTNDVGYLTSSTVLPYIPTQVSSFTNDVGYLTSSTVLPYIPTQVSSFTNDVGYLTSSSNVAYSKITGAPFVISNQYLLTDEKIISLSTSSSLSLSSGSGIQVGPTTGTFASWSFDGISNWQSSGGIIVGTSGILSVLSSVLSTSTVTGALVVKGGVGIGGNLYSLTAYSNGSRVITTSTLASDFLNSISSGSGITISSSTNAVIISSVDTLQLVTSRGNSTTNTINITNTTSFSTKTGALLVAGGVGIGQDLNVSGRIDIGQDLNVGGSAIISGQSLSVNGAHFLVDVNNILSAAPTISLSILQQSKGAAQGSGILLGPIGNSFFEWIFDGISAWETSGGITAGGILKVGSNFGAYSTVSGALRVIGGAGIGGNLYVGGDIISNNSPVITLKSMSSSVVVSLVSTDTSISISTSVGFVSIASADTLQLVTSRGNISSNPISITSTASSISTVTGALIVAGGVGIGGDLFAKTIYSDNSPVITQKNVSLDLITNNNNSTTNAINLNVNTISSSTNTGALIVKGGVGVGGNLYVGGNIFTNGLPVITAATLKDYGVAQIAAGDQYISISTSTGYVVIGNKGVQQINAGIGISVSSSTGIVQINNIGVTYITGTQYLGVSATTGSVELTNLGIVSVTPGSGIDVLQLPHTTGQLVVSSIDTLDLVTSRGNISKKEIKITDTSPASTSTSSNGALQVAGGVGVGENLYVNELITSNNLNVNEIINAGGNIYSSGSQVLTEVSLNSFGVTQLIPGNFISVDPEFGTGIVTINNVGVQTITAGNGISISNSTGTVNISSVATLDQITTFGNISSASIIISSKSSATQTYETIGNNEISYSQHGAIQVIGGASIGGDLYVGTYVSAGQSQYWTGGNIFSNGFITITSKSLQNFLVSGSGISLSTSTLSNSIGVISISSIDTLQSITTRGSNTNNAINITNPTNAISQSSGALVVAGGIGISGDIYGRNIFSNGLPVLTPQTIGEYGVSAIIAGTAIGLNPNFGTGSVTISNLGVSQIINGNGISISTSTGTVNISCNLTFQSITDIYNSTSNIINITNLTNSTSTNSGALLVAGGASIGKNLNVSGYISSNVKLLTLSAAAKSSSGATASGLQIGLSSSPYATWFYNSLQSSWESNIGIISNGNALITGNTEIVGDLTVDSGNIYSNGWPVLTPNTIGLWGVSQLISGDGISISTSVGVVSISNNASLQVVTNNGSISSNPINITNSTTSISSLTGALVVTGGVGISGNINVGGTMNILGLVTFSSPVTFNGTATYVNSTNSVYTDNIIELHSPTGGVNGQWTVDDKKDIGLRFHYYNSTDSNAALVLASDSKMLEWYNTGAETSTGTFSGSNASYGGFKLGNIQLTSTSTSLSTITGALIVAGGVGVGGSLYAGGVITATNMFIGLWPVSTGTVNGAIAVNITNTLSSISTTTGALQVAGGVGIGGNLYTSGNVRLLNTVSSTSTITGALTVAGGVGIGGNLNIGGIVNISNTLSSTSTITGAVVVAGGVGISGNLYANNIYSNNASVITTATLFNNLTGVASVVNSNTWTATQSLAGSASTLGTVITTAAELTYIINTPPPSTSTMYLNLGEVQYFTVASTSNWVTNFAFSNTTPLNTALSTGQSTTVVTMSVQGTTAYYNTGILIDGITINPYWQGGAAPSNGYPSGIDVYTYTIIKIGNATFTVLATQTRF